MNKRFLHSLLGLCLVSLSLFGQKNVKHQAFSPGEQLKYKAYYNWGFIWLYAGDVTFSVNFSKESNKIYHFSSIGKTRKGYDWLYKVRDKFESKAFAESLAPVSYSRKTFEGGYFVNNYYQFDYKKKKIYTSTENSKKPNTRDTLDLQNRTIDVLTAIYYCRNLQFSTLQINDTIPLRLIIDNQIYNLHIRYLGIDNITLKNKKTYTCIKFSILLVAGTIFKGGEDLYVWVTNDKHRIPVLVESKILVGSVKAMIEDIGP